MERIWDILLASCKDVQAAVSAKVGDLTTKSSLANLQKGEVKLALALKFITKRKELRRMQKMAKKFKEFVHVATEKR